MASSITSSVVSIDRAMRAIDSLKNDQTRLVLPQSEPATLYTFLRVSITDTQAVRYKDPSSWTDEFLASCSSQEDLPKRVSEVATTVLKAIFYPDSSRDGALDYAYLGRWLLAEPDSGFQLIQRVATLAPEESIDSALLHDRLIRLAQEYLISIAQMSIVEDSSQVLIGAGWDLIRRIVKNKASLAEENALADLLAALKPFHLIKTKPMDLICALWGPLKGKSSSKTIKNFNKFIVKVETWDPYHQWIFKGLNEGYQLVPKGTQPIRAPWGFVKLLSHQDRVLPAPEILELGPFFKWVRFSPLKCSLKQWRVQWLQGKAEDGSEVMLAAALGAGLKNNKMPKWADIYEAGFYNTGLASVTPIVWCEAEALLFEKFIWQFCQGSLVHYDRLMQKTGLHHYPPYQRHIHHLQQTLSPLYQAPDDWQYLTGPSFSVIEGARSRLLDYLEGAKKHFELDQAVQYVQEAIRLSCHPLRSTAEEWLTEAMKIQQVRTAVNMQSFNEHVSVSKKLSIEARKGHQLST